MDKFGRGRVKRGPAGPAGKDAFNLYHWCPTVLLHLFRESEKCTYFFNTATDGIVKEGSKYFLKDQNGVNNAICLQNYEKPVPYQGVFILPLQGALYQIDHISQALTPPSITVFAFNFKLAKKDPPPGPHFIFSNWSKTRGVYFTKNHLDICGTDPLLLEYDNDDWNRMIIQYTNLEFIGGCSFMLNGRKGFFVRKPYEKKEKEIIFLGGHPSLEQSYSAGIYISNFEIYTKIFENPSPTDYQVPEEILKVINAEFMNCTS